MSDMGEHVRSVIEVAVSKRQAVSLKDFGALYIDVRRLEWGLSLTWCDETSSLSREIEVWQIHHIVPHV